MANAAQARQTKERFAQPEEQLSYELGKAVQELPPLYIEIISGNDERHCIWSDRLGVLLANR